VGQSLSQISVTQPTEASTREDPDTLLGGVKCGALFAASIDWDCDSVFLCRKNVTKRESCTTFGDGPLQHPGQNTLASTILGRHKREGHELRLHCGTWSSFIPREVGCLEDLRGHIWCMAMQYEALSYSTLALRTPPTLDDLLISAWEMPLLCALISFRVVVLIFYAIGCKQQ
jgi:hypothetical protein